MTEKTDATTKPRKFRCDQLNPKTGNECGNTLYEQDAYELKYNPGCIVIDCTVCGYGWQLWKLERRLLREV